MSIQANEEKGFNQVDQSDEKVFNQVEQNSLRELLQRVLDRQDLLEQQMKVRDAETSISNYENTPHPSKHGRRETMYQQATSEVMESPLPRRVNPRTSMGPAPVA